MVISKIFFSNTLKMKNIQIFEFIINYLKIDNIINILLCNKDIYTNLNNNISFRKYIINKYHKIYISQSINRFTNLEIFKLYKFEIYNKFIKKYKKNNNKYSSKNPQSIYEICLDIFNYNKKFSDIFNNLIKTKNLDKQLEERCRKNGNYGYSFHSLTGKQIETITNEIIIYYN